jgi:4-amino-4-deoxy-L-arabinose transferase-like glycosyltransferase
MAGSAPAPSRSSKQVLYVTTGLVVVAAALRVLAAVRDHGIYYPDEIHQTTEQGHRLAFGAGLTPWEFRFGARSWLFPGVLAGVMRLGAMLGADSGLAFMVMVKLVMAGLSVAAIVLSVRLARRLGGDVAALLCAAFLAFFPVTLVLSHRALTEVASAPLLVAAVLLALQPGGARPWLAGALAAAAVFVRFQSVVIVVVLLGWLYASRRGRDGERFIQAAAVVGFLGGLLDWITWSRPFASLVNNYKANTENPAIAHMHDAPWWFYAQTLWSATGPAIVLLVALAALAWRRAALPLLCVAMFLAAHVAVPNKQIRFLVPVLPLFLVAAAVGGASLAERLRARPGVMLTAAAVVVGLLGWRAARLTHADMGQREAAVPVSASIWEGAGEINVLLSRAGRRDDLCGVLVAAKDWRWTGAYSYLHRDVPLRFDRGVDSLQAANYAVAPVERHGGMPPEWRAVLREGDWALYQRAGRCDVVQPAELL